MFELHIHAARGIGRLLQEDGIPCDFADVNGDGLALGGEDVVHQGDVLRRKVTAHREDEDTGLERRTVGGGVVSAGGVSCWGSG